MKNSYHSRNPLVCSSKYDCSQELAFSWPWHHRLVLPIFVTIITCSFVSTSFQPILCFVACKRSLFTESPKFWRGELTRRMFTVLPRGGCSVGKERGYWAAEGGRCGGEPRTWISGQEENSSRETRITGKEQQATLAQKQCERVNWDKRIRTLLTHNFTSSHPLRSHTNSQKYVNLKLRKCHPLNSNTIFPENSLQLISSHY